MMYDNSDNHGALKPTTTYNALPLAVALESRCRNILTNRLLQSVDLLGYA